MEDLIRKLNCCTTNPAISTTPILDCVRIQKYPFKKHPFDCDSVIILGQYNCNYVLTIGQYTNDDLYMSVFSAITADWSIPISINLNLRFDEIVSITCSSKSNYICIVTRTRAYFCCPQTHSIQFLDVIAGFVTAVISPCGTKMAYIDSTHLHLHVYDRLEANTIDVYHDNTHLYAPLFSPSGNRLVITNANGQVLYFDTTTQQYELVFVVNSFPSDNALLCRHIMHENSSMPHNEIRVPPKWIVLCDDDQHCMIATQHHLTVYLGNESHFIFDVPSATNGFIGNDFYAIIDSNDNVLFYDEKNTRRISIEVNLTKNNTKSKLLCSQPFLLSVDGWKVVWFVDSSGKAHCIEAIC